MNDFSNEKWKPIDGIESAFISDYGRVKTISKPRETILKAQHSIKARKKKPAKSIRVMIDRRRVTGKAHYITVAMCVAKHFLPNNGNFKQIVYKDLDYTNCKSSNLMYKHDFNSIAPDSVLIKYSKFKTPIGIAVYKYVCGDKETIFTEIEKLRTKFTKILQLKYRLCESDADEAFWIAITKFIQKIPTGFLSSAETIEGLILTSCKFKALVISSQNHKSRAMIGESLNHSELNYIDTIAHSDISGKTQFMSDSYVELHR